MILSIAAPISSFAIDVALSLLHPAPTTTLTSSVGSTVNNKESMLRAHQLNSKTNTTVVIPTPTFVARGSDCVRRTTLAPPSTATPRIPLSMSNSGLSPLRIVAVRPPELSLGDWPPEFCDVPSPLDPDAMLTFQIVPLSPTSKTDSFSGIGYPLVLIPDDILVTEYWMYELFCAIQSVACPGILDPPPTVIRSVLVFQVAVCLCDWRLITSFGDPRLSYMISLTAPFFGSIVTSSVFANRICPGTVSDWVSVTSCVCVYVPSGFCVWTVNVYSLPGVMSGCDTLCCWALSLLMISRRGFCSVVIVYCCVEPSGRIRTSILLVSATPVLRNVFCGTTIARSSERYSPVIFLLRSFWEIWIGTSVSGTPMTVDEGSLIPSDVTCGVPVPRST